MSSYLNLLMYLKQCESDSNEHKIEHLFPNASINEIRSILQELSEEGLIKYSGRRQQNLSFILESNILTGESKFTSNPLNEFILNSEQEEFKAKITFKGLRYLKEESQLKDTSKYNINLSGSGTTNNVIIESTNVKILNKKEPQKYIEYIIQTLLKDATVDTIVKNETLQILLEAKNEINQKNALSPNVYEKLIDYGSKISSIGQLILSFLN